MPQRSTWRTSMSPRSMRLQVGRPRAAEPQGSPQQVPPMQGKLQRSWPKRDDRPGCRKNRKNRNGWRRKSRTGWRKRN
uniref:MAP7 domain containing 2 n=2 Tax=Rousettus aegyptiacus TaxID=9407 RepID=A0A7J8EKK3_ROUAE|nr:MAP7 domain containing 2 [Rousettus aegyptiacus]